MENLRTILAATDFSDPAGRAVQRAGVLASEHAAQLRLLHVLEPDALLALRDLLPGGLDVQAAVAEQADLLLRAAVAQLREQQGVQAQPVLRSGRLLHELDDQERQADVTVLGAVGSHAVRELTLGTTADRRGVASSGYHGTGCRSWPMTGTRASPPRMGIPAKVWRPRTSPAGCWPTSSPRRTRH